MDKVRLGRALGYGARHAARAAMQAVDAATAPDPTPRTTSSQPRPVPTVITPPPDRIAQAHRTATASIQQAKVAGSQARVLGRSVWSPVAKFSSVLWLQVTGTLYTLVALTLGQAVWTRRHAIHWPASTSPAQQLYLLTAAFALFAYFAISAFIRAARR